MDIYISLINNSVICKFQNNVNQELFSTIYLLNADIVNAQPHLKKALSIYEILWEHELEMFEPKKQEITNLHVQTGLTIGQKLIQKRHCQKCPLRENKGHFYFNSNQFSNQIL